MKSENTEKQNTVKGKITSTTHPWTVRSTYGLCGSGERYYRTRGEAERVAALDGGQVAMTRPD